VDAYSEIFDLNSGSPTEVEGFLLDELGTDFGETQLDLMIATFVQAEAGVYGYEGFIDLGGNVPPHVSPGTTSVDLEPFAGRYRFHDNLSCWPNAAHQCITFVDRLCTARRCLTFCGRPLLGIFSKNDRPISSSQLSTAILGACLGK
jgi:hypothetical protein